MKRNKIVYNKQNSLNVLIEQLLELLKKTKEAEELSEIKKKKIKNKIMSEIKKLLKNKIEYDYDKESDTLTLTLKKQKIYESEEISEDIIVDYDRKGNIVSIEILEGSKLLYS